MLVDATARYKVISFMDDNAGYNQFFMAEEDIAKAAFRCPSIIDLFEWVVMTFGYKSTKYVLLNDKLYYKTVDGVLLKCLS